MKNMNKKIFAQLVLVFTVFTAGAQDINKLISVSEVTRIEGVLAADDMQGRKTYSAGIDKAADFIAAEFTKTDLKFFKDANSYKQPFSMLKAKFISATGIIDAASVPADNILAVTTSANIKMDEKSGYEKFVIDSGANLVREGFKIVMASKKSIVFVNTAHARNFSRLKSLKRESMGEKEPVIFVLTDSNPTSFSFDVNHEVTTSALSNVVGVLPGKIKKDELVIFSAHYDHLGIGKPNAAGDSLYNGANDDAAGTTAVIILANYFKKLNNNERTLLFVAFTAEEIGGFGSQYFSKQIDADKAVAMFNIEMIGTESQWGKNSAYITGYEKSDFGKILQANLAGTNFKFEPDPYPKQNLFYRSDNATLAALGVPAHTISTSKMDSEKFYHTQEDELETLDMANMAGIIKAIAISSKGIVSGKETPARVEKMNR